MKELHERYYYFRDEQNAPRITVCLLRIGEQTTRGIAICSGLDNPCKQIGRDIAKGRAYKAIFAEKSNCGMHRTDALWTWHCLLSLDDRKDIDLHKSSYNPILTDFERKLLKRKSVVIYEQQILFKTTPPTLLDPQKFQENCRKEIIQFVNDMFPTLRSADDKIRISINV